MKIMILGGCGYIGTTLVEKLLEKNYALVVVDIQWFGNYLKKNKNLEIIKKDIRNLEFKDFNNISTIIHLANIANDPAVELNKNLSWEVNVLATQQISDLAFRSGVKHIIYASSGSVYGVKEENKVTENLILVPISTYNKTKMVAERILLSYQDDLRIHCIRPATVSGYSLRMRLDLTVNMLTMQALKNKQMTIFGGSQIRPNIHIQDMVNVYLHFLSNKNLPSGCYNAGFENISVLNIAKKIQKKLPSKIKISESIDLRSYRLDSSKLISSGFEAKYNIENAIDEIIEKFNNGILKDNESFYTVNWMKKLKI